MIKNPFGNGINILPLVIILVMSLGSCLLYYMLEQKELHYIKTLLEKEVVRIESLLTSQTNENFSALKRMAQRWENANGTPFKVWQQDARNHTMQIAGLKVVEWIDNTYHIRWAEPYAGNEKVIGMNIISGPTRQHDIEKAAETGSLWVTAPFELKQGYQAFIVYFPLKVQEQFQGFIAGIFSIHDFFNAIIIQDIMEDYAIALSYGGQNYYQNESYVLLENTSLYIEKDLRIHDKKWQLRVVPTKKFIESQKSLSPLIVLIAGLLISVLSSLTVRYILLFRLKSKHLEQSNQEIKQKTVALAASEERYDLVVRGMSVGLWDWNIETNGLYWSEKFKTLLGIKEEEFTCRYDEFIHRLHPDDKERTLKLLNAHLEGRFPYNVEYRLRHNNGTYIWIHAYGQAKWNEQKKPIRMAGSVNNISERVAAAKALQESNSLKSAILASTHYIVVATNIEGVVTIFNEAAEKALGYKASEVVGKVTPLIWHIPEEIDEKAVKLRSELGCSITADLEVLVKKAVLTGVDEDEWTLVRKDGSCFPAHLTVTPLRNNQQEITGYLGVIEDITKRKEQQEALKISEETFRLAMENASIGMALLEPSGRWKKVNRALCDLLGYSEEELLANDFQSITYPEDVEQNLEYMLNLIAGDIKTYQTEQRYYHKSGRTIWALLSMSLVSYSNGEANYFIAQINDITEQKQIEQMKNEFISVVSHELRTPLTSIRGALGFMAGTMKKDLPEKANHLIDIAYKNCERLILLINDILDIDKIASGQMRFDMKEELLAPLIEQAIDANQPYADKFGVSITASPVDPALKIKVDAARFLQVLANLLSNAAKFSKQGGIVEIKAFPSGIHIRIAVIDHGPGIAEEFRSRIFGKFSQADSSIARTKDGTGLGLHITKQIVEHMHGVIGFDTEVGQGTTFWIEFPAIHSEAIVELENQPIGLWKSKSVLICEDNKDIAFLIKTMLEAAGFHADIAYTIPQAKRMLKEKQYSLMTLDLILPMGDGIQFIKELRTSENMPDLPVIIISAKANEVKNRVTDDKLGIAGWLSKPIDEEKLIRTAKYAVSDFKNLPHILHVENDVDLSNMLATALYGKADITTATTLKYAEKVLQLEDFAMIILDIEMPDGSGLDLLERLPELTKQPLPVMILSATEIPETVRSKVAVAMVKSRVSETKIIETILHLIHKD